MNRTGALTPELRDLSVRIEAVARDAGLDFFDVAFELLEARDVNAIAAFGGFQHGDTDQPEQQLGAAFTDEHRAYGGAEKAADVGLGLIDDPDQFVRGRVVAALVVGDRRQLRRAIDYGFQGQRTAGILEKNARSLVGAVIDVLESITNFVQ